MSILRIVKLFSIISMSVLFFGCMSAQEHYQQTHGPKEQEMTIGVVQKEIRKGMSAAEVAEALGSPNIVTTDSEGREVWVYDKISTDVTYSTSQGYASILIAGVGSSAGAKSQTQKTLTVVIKFDEEKKVRDFAYHSSKF